MKWVPFNEFYDCFASLSTIPVVVEKTADHIHEKTHIIIIALLFPKHSAWLQGAAVLQKQARLAKIALARESFFRFACPEHGGYCLSFFRFIDAIIEEKCVEYKMRASLMTISQFSVFPAFETLVPVTSTCEPGLFLLEHGISADVVEQLGREGLVRTMKSGEYFWLVVKYSPHILCGEKHSRNSFVCQFIPATSSRLSAKLALKKGPWRNGKDVSKGNMSPASDVLSGTSFFLHGKNADAKNKWPTSGGTFSEQEDVLVVSTDIISGLSAYTISDGSADILIVSDNENDGCGLQKLNLVADAQWRKKNYIFVSESGERGNPIVAAATKWAGDGVSCNLVLTEGNTTEDLRSALKHPLYNITVSPKGITDGRSIFPVGTGIPIVPRVPLSEAEKELREAFSSYRTGTRMVIAIDPGAGKTFTLSELHQILGPILFLSPTLALGRDFIKEVNAKIPNSGIVFNGRNKSLCHKISEVEELGKSRRSINANLCRTCVHGLSTQVAYGSATALQTMEEMIAAGLIDGPEEGCGYIEQMHNLKHYPVVACAEASLAGTPHHLTTTGTKEEPIPRTLVWDDCFTPFSEVVIERKDLRVWAERGETVMENDLSNPARKNWVEKVLPALLHILGLFEMSFGNDENLPSCLTDLPCPAGFPSWNDVAEAIKNFPKEAKSRDGVVLESIQIENGVREVPLRALLDLARAIKDKTVWITGNKLVCTIPTLSLLTFLEQGGIVLDATPDPFLRAIADRTVEIRIKQESLQVLLDASRFRGRSSLKTPDGIRRSLSDIFHVWKTLCEDEKPKNVAVITHKPLSSPLSEHMKREKVTGPSVGHWGAAQRGHNDYLHAKILVLDGVPIPPPSACFLKYETCRIWLDKLDGDASISSGIVRAKRKRWSPYSDIRSEQMVEIPFNGSAGSVRAMLPENPDVSGWLRETVTAEVVQAVGRLRAVRRNRQSLIVLVRTAFPLAAEYGFAFTGVYEKNGGITQTVCYQNETDNGSKKSVEGESENSKADADGTGAQGCLYGRAPQTELYPCGKTLSKGETIRQNNIMTGTG